MKNPASPLEFHRTGAPYLSVLLFEDRFRADSLETVCVVGYVATILWTPCLSG